MTRWPPKGRNLSSLKDFAHILTFKLTSLFAAESLVWNWYFTKIKPFEHIFTQKMPAFFQNPKEFSHRPGKFLSHRHKICLQIHIPTAPSELINVMILSNSVRATKLSVTM